MTEVGRGCWRKPGGALPWYGLSPVGTPQVGELWYRHQQKSLTPELEALVVARPHAYQFVNTGVRVIQQTLYNDFGFVLDTDGWLGKKTSGAITVFQGEHGLVVDGNAGPRTMRALLNPMLTRTMKYAGMDPSLNQYVDGLLNYESGYDGGGSSEEAITEFDVGIAQIRIPVHNVTFEQALDPYFAISWTVKEFKTAYYKFKPLCVKSGANLVWCAIANHNSPVRAESWATTGTAPYDPRLSIQIDEYVMGVLAAI